MKLNNLLPGVILAEQIIHKDERGSFCETWKKIDDDLFGWYRQLNTSVSVSNVFRGMHRSGQRKLVMPMCGNIIDYVLNPETGEWCCVLLDNTKSLFIPAEYAHGYYAVNDCVVQYMVDQPWNKNTEEQFKYYEYDISIPSDNPILSDKDK